MEWLGNSRKTFSLHDVILAEQQAQTHRCVIGESLELIFALDIFLFIPRYSKVGNQKIDQKIFLITETTYRNIDYRYEIEIASMSEEGKIYHVLSDEEIEKKIDAIKKDILKKSQANKQQIFFRSFPFSIMTVSAFITLLTLFFFIPEEIHRGYPAVIYCSAFFFFAGLVVFNSSSFSKEERIPWWLLAIHAGILAFFLIPKFL